MNALLIILLSALTVSGSGVRLEWTHATGDPLGYRIYWGPFAGGGYQWVTNLPHTNRWILWGFENGKSYYFVATATNLDGESLPSNEASTEIPTDTPPDAILDLRATLLSSTNLSGSWNNRYTWPEVIVPATNQEHLFRVRMEIKQ